MAKFQRQSPKLWEGDVYSSNVPIYHPRSGISINQTEKITYDLGTINNEIAFNEHTGPTVIDTKRGKREVVEIANFPNSAAPITSGIIFTGNTLEAGDPMIPVNNGTITSNTLQNSTELVDGSTVVWLSAKPYNTRFNPYTGVTYYMSPFFYISTSSATLADACAVGGIEPYLFFYTLLNEPYDESFVVVAGGGVLKDSGLPCDTRTYTFNTSVINYDGTPNLFGINNLTGEVSVNGNLLANVGPFGYIPDTKITFMKMVNPPFYVLAAIAFTDYAKNVKIHAFKHYDGVNLTLKDYKRLYDAGPQASREALRL